MEFCPLFRRRRPRQVRRQTRLLISLPPVPPLLSILMLLTAALVVALSWTKLHPRFSYPNLIVSDLADMWRYNEPTSMFQFQGYDKAAEPSKHSHQSFARFNSSQAETRSEYYTPLHHQSGASSPPPQQLQMRRKTGNRGPYHDWDVFSADYQDMLRTLKIFVYPDALRENNTSSTPSPFDSIFLPLAKPTDPKLGNYFSEHAFKVALLRSSLLTKRPEEAHFFFMPFSVNAMRNHPRLHSASSIPDFVAQYTRKISSEFRYWNASGGADHFYVCCHSIGREAASKHPALHTNAIQVTCSSSYFQRLYVTHKDFGLPQIWPRRQEPATNPPDARKILLFFAGRAQNSLIRQKILDMWSNDTSFAIFSGSSAFPYTEGFRRSKYCLHVKGYEVNTARVSDAIHYGCIPVLISNYYDLPFANILDWRKFSIIISHEDIPLLKEILSSVSKKMYLMLYKNLGIVRKHFIWHTTPRSYDSFYMTAYQLWLRRGFGPMVGKRCASACAVLSDKMKISCRWLQSGNF